MVKATNRTGVSKILLMLTTSLSVTACSSVEPKVTATPSEGPAIWTLTDDDTQLHIFGFAPVLKPGVEWKTNAIMQALADANLLVVESINSSPEAQKAVQSLIPQLGINTDGSTLSSKLNEAEYQEVNDVSSGFGAPLQALDQLKPWLANVQLGALAISTKGYDLENSPASVLTSQAQNTGIDVRALEEPTELMTLMASFSESEQIKMLVHTARTLRVDPEQQDRLNSAWLRGDVKEVGEGLHGTGGAWSSDMIYQAMLVDRNDKWAEEIEEIMATEQGVIFLAVGYGHLAGKDSLISTLRAKGLPPVRK